MRVKHIKEGLEKKYIWRKGRVGNREKCRQERGQSGKTFLRGEGNEIQIIHCGCSHAEHTEHSDEYGPMVR